MTPSENTDSSARSRQATLCAPLTRWGAVWPLLASALILLGAAFQLPSLHFVGNTGPELGFELAQPFGYVLLSPVVRLLDELALVTESQHIALGISIALLVSWWRLREYARAGKRPFMRQALLLVRGLSVGVAAAVFLYLIAALVPRPMVRLQAHDPAVILVDFHSHTEQSHDGRWRFDAEANRDWHESAGFRAAYVTDHQTMRAWQALSNAGSLAGGQRNVSTASVFGALTRVPPATLLPGIETVVPGAHVVLLGVTGAHETLFSHRRDLDTLGFSSIAATEPRVLALLTLPYNLERDPARTPVVDAVEISNGSPKGLTFARRHRSRIIGLADSLRVPLIASSNNHGWGSTAVAWTAMRIPGWQRLAPADLDAHIRATLRAKAAPVGVVERNALAPGNGFLEDAATLPRLVIHAWRIARPWERLAALAWLWSIWLLRTGWRGSWAQKGLRRKRSTV